jgi:parvulin-like peptidyl-prolyl isomerase
MTSSIIQGLQSVVHNMVSYGRLLGSVASILVAGSYGILLAQFTPPSPNGFGPTQFPPSAARPNGPITNYTGQPRGQGQPPAANLPTATPQSAIPAQPQSSNSDSAINSTTGELYEAATIVAVVGDQYILAGDLSAAINQRLEPHLAKMTDEQKKVARTQLMQQFLGREIETKLLYLDFLRGLPADKLDEILPQITKQTTEQFLEKELPEMIEKFDVADAKALEIFLRNYGSSIAKRRRKFAERSLGRAALQRSVEFDPEVTHEEMLNLFQDNIAKYEYPAKAKWERLMVSFEKVPDKQQAFRIIAEMGNAVLRNAPFAEVAKRDSHCPMAVQGGKYDWTTKGSLRSDTIDEAIFSLDVNKLSQVIEDEQGFHIIRVTERQNAGRESFLDAQVEIRETIKKKKLAENIQKYVKNLQETTTVWTIFDKSQQQSVATPPAAQPSLR